MGILRVAIDTQKTQAIINAARRVVARATQDGLAEVAAAARSILDEATQLHNISRGGIAPQTADAYVSNLIGMLAYIDDAFGDNPYASEVAAEINGLKSAIRNFNPHESGATPGAYYSQPKPAGITDAQLMDAIENDATRTESTLYTPIIQSVFNPDSSSSDDLTDEDFENFDNIDFEDEGDEIVGEIVDDVDGNINDIYSAGYGDGDVGDIDEILEGIDPSIASSEIDKRIIKLQYAIMKTGPLTIKNAMKARKEAKNIVRMEELASLL